MRAVLCGLCGQRVGLCSVTTGESVRCCRGRLTGGERISLGGGVYPATGCGLCVVGGAKAMILGDIIHGLIDHGVRCHVSFRSEDTVLRGCEVKELVDGDFTSVLHLHVSFAVVDTITLWGGNDVAFFCLERIGQVFAVVLPSAFWEQGRTGASGAKASISGTAVNTRKVVQQLLCLSSGVSAHVADVFARLACDVVEHGALGVTLLSLTLSLLAVSYTHLTLPTKA